MWIGLGAGALAGALWGLVFIAPRMSAGYSTVDLAAGRFMVYGLVSVAHLALTDGLRSRPSPAQALAALGMSVLGFTGYYALLAFAIRNAGTELPTLIIGTIPLWVTVLGKPQDLRLSALLPGIALTILGLLLMASAQAPDASGQSATGHWVGLGATALALAFWVAFSLLNSRWLAAHPDLGATRWTNWLGIGAGLGGLALWWTAGSPIEVLAQQPRLLELVLLVAVLGVGSTWLATVCWNVASQRLSASLCGQLILCETLFALLYSFTWDQRYPSVAQVTACVLFTAGIVASVRAHGPAAQRLGHGHGPPAQPVPGGHGP
ncbi:DMT family transporter [Hydrogenophaga sp.]|uniref:DMT family transporter n=1 Tax=Hydrogenophaga sp. TaxID=1904254 RepID=UPI002630D6F0|nr:DMT family transporter [Hydrogenophaga sp.]MCW5654853.1 DMT family transporter [Hydrogenophaga sp.]